MFLQKVKALCEKEGISIAKLEKECGIGNGVIRDWDTSNPSIKSLNKVANYFHLPISYFFGNDEPRPDEN